MTQPFIIILNLAWECVCVLLVRNTRKSYVDVQIRPTHTHTQVEREELRQKIRQK